MEELPSQDLNIIEQDKQRCWSSLDDVGPNKPVGYLPIETLETYVGKNPSEVIEYLQSKGLETVIFKGYEWPGHKGSLYAYEKVSLQKLLDENKQILLDANWPTRANEFVDNLKVQERVGTPLYKLIAKTFADTFSENLEEEE